LTKRFNVVRVKSCRWIHPVPPSAETPVWRKKSVDAAVWETSGGGGGSVIEEDIVVVLVGMFDGVVFIQTVEPRTRENPGDGTCQYCTRSGSMLHKKTECSRLDQS